MHLICFKKLKVVKLQLPKNYTNGQLIHALLCATPIITYFSSIYKKKSILMKYISMNSYSYLGKNRL